MALKPLAPLITAPKRQRIDGIQAALTAGSQALVGGVGLDPTLTAGIGLESTPQSTLLRPKKLESLSLSPNPTPTTLLAKSAVNPGYSTPTGSSSNPLEAIKAGITKLESGGNYKAKSKTSSASGRYQYLDGTWGGYKGYKSAADAPPEIQDEKFNQDMGKYLKRYNNNFEAASIAWFQGPGVADKFMKGDTSVLAKTDANGKTTASYAKEAADIARSYVSGSGAPPVGTGSTKHLELAVTQFGTKEGAGNSNPYSREMANSSGQAWCQDFVNWNLKHSGIKLPEGANTSSTLNSFAAWKKAGKVVNPAEVMPGDMLYKTREKGGHVALVVSYDPKTGTVKTISGNSGKGSSEVSYSTSNISSWNIGAVRPT